MKQTTPNLLDVFNPPTGTTMEQVGIASFAVVMAASFACSVFASYLYVVFYSGRATGSRIHRAFPLLGLSITAIFLCIQFSLPLSLGLLGALSIVRFRTPIKEPEEVAFIMFVIAISIAAATFHFRFLGIFLASAVVALLLLRYAFAPLAGREQDGVIVIELTGDGDPTQQNEILSLLASRVRRGALESLSRTANGVELAYGFRGLRESSVVDVRRALEERLAGARFSIFFNRPQAL